MKTGFPAPILLAIPSSGIIPNAPTTLTYSVMPTDLVHGQIQSWNLALQRQLPASFTIDVAYVGNHGVNDPVSLQLNRGLVIGAGAAGTAAEPGIRPARQHQHDHRGQHQLQQPAGQAEPPVPERLPADDFVHVQQGDRLLFGPCLHAVQPVRFPAEPRAFGFRPHAGVRAERGLRTAGRPGQEVADRRGGGLYPGRLAGERGLHRADRRTAEHSIQQCRLECSVHQQPTERQRAGGDLRQGEVRGGVVRHDAIFRAGQRDASEMWDGTY